MSDKQPIQLEAKPVYYHDCPALGKRARVAEATMLSSDNTVVLGHQHKCPFCSYVADEFRPAPGVTVNRDGTYTVEMTKAITVEGGGSE
jgi:hypothetical protein